MKNQKFNTLISLLSSFFMMVTMAGCVEPIAVTPPEVDEDVEITFRIAVSGAAGIFTKSDDTVLAVDKEATIYDLQIWAFAKDGSSSETAVGYAHPDDIPAEGWDPTDPNAQVPTIKMKLKKNTQRTPNEMVLSNTTLVFYALANGPSVGISNLTAPSQDDLKGKTITQFGNTQSTTQDAPETGLPMACFFDNGGAGFSIEFLQYGLSTTQINGITGCSGTYNETVFDTQLNNITGLANYQKAYLKTLFKINDNEYKWDAEKVRPTLSLERAVSKIRFVFAKGTNMGETVTNINSIVFTDDNTKKEGIPSETYVFSRSPFDLPTGSAYTTITWEGPTEETVQQPLVASANIKTDGNPLRLRKTSEIEDAGAGKAPKDMNAQEYENFLTTWMGNDKDKTQKVIYLRESDQNVVCWINYTISGNSKCLDITLPKGEGNFLRNHGWTIFAYFVSYELQFQITLDSWSVTDDSIHLWER